MLQFVLGRAGSGKTEYMRKMILERSLAEQGECIMLVPEQYSFETEKAFLRLAGPVRANTIKVYSFTRLGEAVFHREGGAVGTRLSDAGRRILMSCAVAACEDELEVYRSAAKTGRVTELMLTAVNELKMCGISPETISETAQELGGQGLAKKLRELGHIYAAYEGLVAASYLDSRDDLTRLAQLLRDVNVFSGCTIAVDSFEGFTVQELKILGELMCQAENVVVSLCTDGLDGDESGLFALVDRTRRRLTQQAEDMGVKVLPPVTLNRPLRFKNENLKLLEAQLFCAQDRLTSEDCQGVFLYRAADVFQESEFVAATIRRLVFRGYRYRDISIICRDPQRYYGSLDVALKKREIPCFMSQPAQVDSEPVARFVLGAFQVVQGGFATEYLLDMLKTGVSGYSAEEISELENYAYLWLMNGRGLRQDFVRHPRGFGWEMTQEDQEQLRRLNDLRISLIEPLERFADATADASGAEICQAVYDLLLAFGMRENLPEFCRELETVGDDAAAERQIRVWELLMEILDQMYRILGDRKIDRNRFYRLLREVVSAEDVSDIPQRADEVVFGTAEQVRQASPKVAFLIGATQGDFPRSPKSSGVFSDAERRELIAMDLPLGDPLEQKAIEERYLCYSVACAPSEELYISWPCSAGGEDKEPSELVTGVMGVFPNLRPVGDLPEEYISNSREAAFSRMAASWRENSPRAAALRKFVEEEGEFSDRLGALKRAGGLEFGAQERDEKNLRPEKITDPKLVKGLYGDRMYLSPSQIETYHSCAFKYFCRYGLNARERRPAGVDVLQYGMIMHFLFQKVFSDECGARGKAEGQELLELVRELIEEYARENMGGLELLSARERYRLERMAQSACKLIAHVRRELSQSRFVPEHMEWQLGRQGPALKIETGTGKVVTVGGTIDRIDIYHSPQGKRYVLVVDYKTGKKSFRLSDVLYGLNMQMLIYLAAMTQAEGTEPAGILYMPAAEPSVNAQRGAKEDEVAGEAERQLKMSGLVLSDSEIIEAMEAGAKGRFIPAKLNKDKTPSAASSVLSREQLQKVLEYSKRLIATMGRELERGEAGARPNMHNQAACKLCPYGPVCGSELGERDVEKDLKTREQAMEEIEKRLEEGT